MDSKAGFKKGTSIAVWLSMDSKYLSVEMRPFWLYIFLTVANLILPITGYAEVSVLAQQIVPLLPNDARITEVRSDDQLGSKIDELTLSILSTPSGKSFCGAVSENFESFKAAFFLGDTAARKGFQICRGQFAQKQPYRLFQKKYLVVFTDMSDLKIDGWTTPRNETFIFVVQNEFNTARLARTLIHEMAISYDRKEQIGFSGIIDFPKLGIQETEESCLSISILRNAKVKHALSAARAFDMEKRIARELGVALPEGFAAWEGKSCLDKLRFLEPHIISLSSALSAEELVNTLMDKPLCIAAPIQIKNSQQGLQILSELTLTFADGTRRNACEYLSDGWPYFPGVSFRGGPGPRIGGGGWNRLADFTQPRDSILKAATILKGQFQQLNQQVNEIVKQQKLEDLKEK